MSSQPEQTKTPQDPDQAVIDYLQAHPDFFQRHPECLARLELTHPSGEAISLIEHQIKILRQQAAQHQSQMAQFVEVARENELLNERLHKLTLALLDAVTFDEVVNVLEDKLHDDFQAEAVKLHLFTHAETDGNANPDLDGFRPFLEKGEARCGRLSKAQLEYLFSTQAEDIQSTALIPLQEESILGLLAIGSHNAQRFHPGMGTDYLTRLGEIVSKTLEVVSEPGF